MSDLPVINLKRIYELPTPDDGIRILVERLWPRGVTKQAAALDWWARDQAPSPELRAWYGHQPDRWPEFQRRYREELHRNAGIDTLFDVVAGGPSTFLFAARDEERNSAVLLREFVLNALA